MAPIRVLVLDFHQSYREAVHEGLGDYPSDVLVVGADLDWQAALAHIPHLCPEVILFHEHIPLTVLSELHHRHPECRIVLLTSYTYLDLIQEAFRLGAIGYVLLHCCGDDLINVIKQFHSGIRPSGKPPVQLWWNPNLWGYSPYMPPTGSLQYSEWNSTTR